MTKIQKLHGPFAKKTPGWMVPYTVTCSAEDRIRMVRESNDQEWLGDVLKRAEQKTVRVAAARRLKKLLYQEAEAQNEL